MSRRKQVRDWQEEPWTPADRVPATKAQMKKWVEAIVARDDRHDPFMQEGTETPIAN